LNGNVLIHAAVTTVPLKQNVFKRLEAFKALLNTYKCLKTARMRKAMRYLPLIMKPLKTLRLILTFYMSYFVATSLITIACISIFWKYGISTFTTLFWFKIGTLALVYYFIRTTKTKELYYYQNLGVSKALLWTSTLTFDFIIFLSSLIVTYKIK
jgi:hypothetical protein